MGLVSGGKLLVGEFLIAEHAVQHAVQIERQVIRDGAEQFVLL